MPSADTLFALPYVGGKSAASPMQTGVWVASLLPEDGIELYAEPFFGMGGVLLQRKPAAAEIGNDLNRIVINWWLVVADPDLSEYLADWLNRTPLCSEWHYETAYDFLDRWVADDCGTPDVEAAYWWTIRSVMTTAPRLGKSPFALRLSKAVNAFPSEDRLRRLYRRIRKVQLSVRSATEVIEFAGRNPNSLIYADPPYPSSPSYYRYGLEAEDLAAALRGVSGLAAVSGQSGDPWDTLLPGWYRTAYRTMRTMGWENADRKFLNDVDEVVWTNYRPEDYAAQPQLFDA